MISCDEMKLGWMHTCVSIFLTVLTVLHHHHCYTPYLHSYFKAPLKKTELYMKNSEWWIKIKHYLLHNIIQLTSFIVNLMPSGMLVLTISKNTGKEVAERSWICKWKHTNVKQKVDRLGVLLMSWTAKALRCLIDETYWFDIEGKTDLGFLVSWTSFNLFFVYFLCSESIPWLW